MLARLSLAEFIDRLAAGTPTPGGGSAAALAGALAAALCGMVCELTLGREAYRAHEAALRTLRDRAAAGRRDLLDLVDGDAAAFDGVMEALRLPKGTETEKAARRAAVATATLQATVVPMRTAEACAVILAAAVELIDAGNRNARSDAGAAAALASAALTAALLNVRINLGGIDDRERAAALAQRAATLEQEGDRLAGMARAAFGGA